ncbi:beta-lactamase/transpeptidase-like protein [Mycena sp. CBHHK59/15]|nr:beta-lactamase/transpeptidase-like protein [Mycena sp. CBHHK59/15]
MVSPLYSVVFGVLSVATGSYYAGLWTLPFVLVFKDESERFSCRPFLPNLFVEHPPLMDDPGILSASNQLGRFLSDRFSVGNIDSLSVAVVSADGLLFEGNYGVTRGNESQSSPPTTSDSMYRIASVAKLFEVLEGQILAEKSILSWDDPVEKYIPELKYHPGSLTFPQARTATKKQPITLAQLASHMSGLGRDWPPGNVMNWPKDLQGAGPPPTNGLPFPQNAALLRSIMDNPLISPQFTWPIYSNTGVGLLGLALLEADRLARNAKEAISYADLLKGHANKDLIVVPSLAPEVAVRQDFLDAMNPAAGQFSSLRDCVTVTQTLLNPNHPKSLITKATMDQWLRPVHSFEEDDWTEAGFIWEIIKAQDSNKRFRRIYWKLGAMAGYHAALAIHPGTSYGVIVLLSGHFPDAAALAYRAFEIFQPAIDQALAEVSVTRYAGEWISKDGNSTASIAVSRGTLYIDRLTAITLDIGIPYYNGQKHMGCYSYWAGLDLWGMRNGAALNAIYFTGNESERRLHVPAADVEMIRA